MQNMYLITDIGSTTTKAILIEHSEQAWQLKAMANAPTTVEKPQEDVMAGVVNAVRQLQTITGKVLLRTDPATQADKIDPAIPWLSTSSAGGGLQILVIGLTKHESAATAERAAFGAGGVILDTFAIDDGRSMVEQMHTIENLQPDIILMSGGYEGGAYASVLRLAEMLSYCDIKPKYSLKNSIPFIFAGNSEVQAAVANILQDHFEFHLLPNIRPLEAREDISGLKDKVHELFLGKVMQQAPGYAAVSAAVAANLIPTPIGVMQALQIISQKHNKNILAVDIGGATTDVYSNVHGRFYRTVSANFGMSYSLCNVFAQAHPAQLKQWLHADLPEKVLRNYIGNKMLYPAAIPEDDIALHIEQALARIALQLSLRQHLEMNFSIHQIGHFLKLKSDELDPFHEQFFRDKLDEKLQFNLQDFQIIIGAGGVLSHAPQARQAAIMLVDGLQPRGMTELWRDKHFISPHLGVLSNTDPSAAAELMQSDGLEPLCLCIRPLPNKLKAGKPALVVHITKQGATQTMYINANSLSWIENRQPATVTVQGVGSVLPAYEQKELSGETNLPILIDTRIAGSFAFEELNAALALYGKFDFYNIDKSVRSVGGLREQVSFGNQIRCFNLPYAGKLHVSKGDSVFPETLLGENLYDPPRLYVLQIFRGREKELDAKSFQKYLLVKAGEEVTADQLLYDEPFSLVQSLMLGKGYRYYSPVRGKIDRIDVQNGTLLLREIQDYSFNPSIIPVSDKIGVKPALLKTYLHKHLGDFVTTGELLAVKSLKNSGSYLKSPVTGTVTQIDTKNGTVTIQYLKKDLKLYSGLKGKITAISRNRFIELEYSGITIAGSIGFGMTVNGILTWQDSFMESALAQDGIFAYPHTLSREQLKMVAKSKVKGIIVPSIQQADLVELLGHEMGVGITGNEKLPFGLILTEGFGELTYSDLLTKNLKLNSGKHIAMLPATQIRAGVIRPSLIIQ